MEKEMAFIIASKESSSFTQEKLRLLLTGFYPAAEKSTSFIFDTIAREGFFIQPEIISVIKDRFRDWETHFEFFSKNEEGEVSKKHIPEAMKVNYGT